MFYCVVTASHDTADLEATRSSLIVYSRSVELSQYKNLLLHLFSIPTYPIRLARLLYELKPRCDRDRILTASTLAMELLIPLCMKLRLAFNKARHPAFAYGWRRWILAAASE
jgi:hypothetical protein